MSSSMVATIYFIALVVFFILLVVLTIALIASRSGKREEDDTDEIDETEESIFEEAQAQANAEKYEPLTDSAFENMEISDETYVNTFDDEKIANAPTEKLIQPDVHGGDIEGEETPDAEAETPDAEAETDATVTAPYTDASELEPESADESEPADEPDTAEPEQNENSSEEDLFNPETLVDSAFAPEPEETGLTNEAIDESVREAMAMGAAVSGMGAGLSAASMFGVREELEKGYKKNRQRSVVPSTDDFFWFNKLDVAEKPSYKTAEMYYHYFDTAKDCIEDLLIEMYDCALVRTEEIRYIAYGIEPRAISMKEILSSGNYTNEEKLKEPTTQDLVRIYEKWCGYVDKLFDKVEIHADAYTIDEIRNLLCEFGRNDVDVLLEGK